MAEAISEWRIHMGAHKTGTSHVQATLSAMKADLSGMGAIYIETDAVRPLLDDLGPWRPSRWLLGRDALARRIEAGLTSLAGVGDGRMGTRVVISDENILGPLIGVMRPRPYPGLDRRIGALAALARGRPVTLLLSIRSFDRVLPGAYATALRYKRLSPLLVRRRERIFGRPPPRWTDVLERISRAAPGVPIRVWRQEDYRADPRPFISAVLGRDALRVPVLPPPPSTMTPSAGAVAEVERLIRLGANRIEPHTWRARVNGIYAERPARTGTPFEPFGATSVARFAEAYAADAEAIRRHWPGCLVEPWATSAS